MSLVELKQEEIEEVSGAGTFLGDSIINGVNLFNQTLTTANPLFIIVNVKIDLLLLPI